MFVFVSIGVFYFPVLKMTRFESCQ